MLRQLIPFIRFDGYHILADLTGVPDLFAHLKPTLLRLVPGRRGRREPRTLRRWVGAVVTLWVVTVVPVLAGTLVLLVQVFPRVAATLAESLGPRWEAVQASWGSGDAAGVGVGLMAIVAVGFPVLAMSYVLLRGSLAGEPAGVASDGGTARP
jgi:putative peptide zinc metalloprotease protein